MYLSIHTYIYIHMHVYFSRYIEIKWQTNRKEFTIYFILWQKEIPLVLVSTLTMTFERKRANSLYCCRFSRSSTRGKSDQNVSSRYFSIFLWLWRKTRLSKVKSRLYVDTMRCPKVLVFCLFSLVPWLEVTMFPSCLHAHVSFLGKSRSQGNNVEARGLHAAQSDGAAMCDSLGSA